MQNKSVFDEIYKGLGDAIVDIREKVVEEGWFGRSLSDRESTAPQWPEAREAEPNAAHDSAEQNREREAQADREIER